RRLIIARDDNVALDGTGETRLSQQFLGLVRVIPVKLLHVVKRERPGRGLRAHKAVPLPLLHEEAVDDVLLTDPILEGLTHLHIVKRRPGGVDAEAIAAGIPGALPQLDVRNGGPNALQVSDRYRDEVDLLGDE